MSFSATLFYLLGAILMAAFLYDDPELARKHRKRYAAMVIMWPLVILFCFALYAFERD
jgi:hypothetical protein